MKGSSHETSSSSPLTQIILATSSPHLNTRSTAESQLRSALEQNVNEFFRLLVLELANDSAPDISRQLAGLQLKNALYGKSKGFQQKAEQRWVDFVRPEVKQQVRADLLKTLESKTYVGRKFAVLVLAKLAAVELPRNLWPTLLEALLERVNNTGGNFSVETRGSCIQALGFISEEMTASQESGRYLLTEDQTTKIVAAVYQGMLEDPAGAPHGSAEQAARKGIRLEATKSMYYTICLAETMFQNSASRDALMTVFVTCCTDSNYPDVQSHALEVLTRVVEFYYAYLASYMPVLAEKSFELMNGVCRGALSREFAWYYSK